MAQYKTHVGLVANARAKVLYPDTNKCSGCAPENTYEDGEISRDEVIRLYGGIPYCMTCVEFTKKLLKISNCPCYWIEGTQEIK